MTLNRPQGPSNALWLERLSRFPRPLLRYCAFPLQTEARQYTPYRKPVRLGVCHRQPKSVEAPRQYWNCGLFGDSRQLPYQWWIVEGNETRRCRLFIRSRDQLSHRGVSQFLFQKDFLFAKEPFSNNAALLTGFNQSVRFHDRPGLVRVLHAHDVV
jgi:hypothetical protein